MGVPLLPWLLLLLLLISQSAHAGELRVALLASSCTQSDWGAWHLLPAWLRACLVAREKGRHPLQGSGSAFGSGVGAGNRGAGGSFSPWSLRCENTGRETSFGSWSCCIPLSAVCACKWPPSLSLSAILEVNANLSCRCAKTTSDYISPKKYESIEIRPVGSSCRRTEIM